MDTDEEVPMDTKLLYRAGRASRSCREIYVDFNRDTLIVEDSRYSIRARVDDVASLGGLIIFGDGVREILLTVRGGSGNPYVSPDRYHWRIGHFSDDGRRQATLVPDPDVGGPAG